MQSGEPASSQLSLPLGNQAGLSALMLCMTPSGQRKTQASRAGTGGRKAPSKQGLVCLVLVCLALSEDLGVKLIKSELDPFKAEGST